MSETADFLINICPEHEAIAEQQSDACPWCKLSSREAALLQIASSDPVEGDDAKRLLNIAREALSDG